MSEHPWWESDVKEGKRHELVLGACRDLDEQRQTLEQNWLRFAWLYNQRKLLGVDGDWREPSRGDVVANTVVNVIQSVIDTAASIIARNTPRVTFQTDGGDWSLQRRAKWLERYVEAEFHRAEVYRDAPRAFRDACIFGTGVLKIYDDGGRVAVDRVLPDEIVVDETACRSAPPVEMFQRRTVDRRVLARQYPQHAEAIMGAARREWTRWRQVPSQRVLVVEGWRLQGRHVLCVDGVDLVDEPWPHDWFPFAGYHWSEPVAGYWGQGLSEQLAPIQLRLNRLIRTAAQGIDLNALGRWFLRPADANLVKRLNNEPGAVHVYSGDAPPALVTTPAVPQQVLDEIERLIQRAYAIAGISQLTASSLKAPGVESGAAMRELNDIETGRFSIQAQRYERVFLDVARLMVRVTKTMTRAPSAKWNDRNLMRRIEWDDVDLDEDIYSMSLEAASIMSRTPAGRLQAVIELTQAGMIGPDEGRRLLGHPDLEREMSLATAAIEDAEATVERLLDGEYEVPEPVEHLPLAIKRVQLALLKAKRDGAPRRILDGMRDWLAQAVDVEAMSQPAPPEMAEVGAANELPPEMLAAAQAV